MKTIITDWSGKTDRVQFCSAATERQSITIAGQTLVPNEDTAYVEFYMSHAFPVMTKYRTGILPQVVANSYATLNHKVFNLAHIMRKYNPEQNPRDRILGTVVATEFPNPPGLITCTCGCRFDYWKAHDEQSALTSSVPCPGENCAVVHQRPRWTITSLGQTPGIRAVAAMHKAAENVIDILASWFTGITPQGGEWTVSMENSLFQEQGGFLVVGHAGVEEFAEATPDYLKLMGYTYVPFLSAPALLAGCLNTPEDNARDGTTSFRVCRDFRGQEVIFLLGGLDGKIRYRGVGLTPAEGAREAEARVSTMLASAPMVDAGDVFTAFRSFGQKVFDDGGKK